MKNKLTRRNFLKLSGSALAAAAGSYGLTTLLHDKLLWPAEAKVATLADLPPAPFCGPPQSIDQLLVDIAQAAGNYDLFLAGTDGWIYIPPTQNLAPYHPDTAAPDPFNTYMFGFANLTGLQSGEIESQKMKVQHPAPMFWFPQDTEFTARLTNLGLGMRPDLIDDHTIHFHGRRNAIPFFDGEPNTSIAVPIGRIFDYVFDIPMPGTYMYHCHVEEVEHVHLGMTGLVFVTPAQNGTNHNGFTKFVYNDGDGSTGYDREFPMLLSDVWSEAHWDFSHVQLPEWSDYKPNYYLLNGRVYPDTLKPNGYVDFAHPNRTGTDLTPPSGSPELQFQPYSSLVTCNEGERVLIRLANLGFLRQTMSMAGIKMRVVGKDATLLKGRNGEDLSYFTDSISIGPGEAFDIIFEAPSHQGGNPDKYLFYNRNSLAMGNGTGAGAQMTEVHVYPAGTLAPQTEPLT
ncbi:MAG: twin-arginine translocation signal domain-containing protein [Chloroflexi bacterium]|nr:MAG: twin-arginine translocation signal domain-containing protein [Chloroflexota bacterium]